MIRHGRENTWDEYDTLSKISELSFVAHRGYLESLSFE